MADPFTRFRSGAIGRAIQPRTPQQQSPGSFAAPERVVLGPNDTELATLDHVYTPTTLPVRGTGGQSWDSVAPAALAELVRILLTRGYYRINWFAQCEDETGTQRIDINVYPRSGVYLNRVNFITRLAGTSGQFDIWQPEVWVPNLTVGGSTYPRLQVQNVDTVAAGLRSIGWIQVRRMWTDVRDPGE